MTSTLVLQSYRTVNVPHWIQRCLESVKIWAEKRGYIYEFVGDEFFSYAPQWVRERCGQHFYPVTDIARLYLIRERLTQGGHARAVWIDADVVVFDPERFTIETRSGYAFSHEVTMTVREGGGWDLSPWGINNAVMVFNLDHPVLDYYIFAAEELIRLTPVNKYSRTMIGPGFLTALSAAAPVERLTCVGLFTPEYLRILADQSSPELLGAYRKHFGFHMAAANLCHFVRGGANAAEAQQMDALFDRAIDKLIRTGGKIANEPGTGTDSAVRSSIFTDIYKNSLWGSGSDCAPYSGLGSEEALSSPYVIKMGEWLAKHNVKRVVDVGCGNFLITGKLASQHPKIQFIGMDIVRHVIEYARKQYANLRNVELYVTDAICDALPVGDVCLLRQILQHYDNASVATLLARLCANYRYCIVTEHIRMDTRLTPNLDKPVDQHIREGAGLLFDQPPFSMKTMVLLDVPYRDNEVLRTVLIETAGQLEQLSPAN